MNPMPYILRHPMQAAFGALGLLIIAMMSLSVVSETQQAIILRYGQIERIINPYRPNQSFGATGAGLSFRIPFVEQIQLIDKRVLGVEIDGQPVLSTDQLRMQVDAYARYRITDPARMYASIRNQDALEGQLRNLLSSALRNELGRRPFSALLSPERAQVMAGIRNTMARDSRRYGVEVIDVRISRAELPEGAPRDSAFERMRTARAQEAAAILAEGQKQAQIVRADAQAEAAQIYANSFGKDPEFYAFWRAMQSYRVTFQSQGAGQSTFVLRPGEGYLSEFGNRSAR